MSDVQAKEAAKRDRSPKFPYISLTKALQRIEVLFSKVRRGEARVADIAKDWDLSAKSSSTDRTIAALQSFGLIEDLGGGGARKIKISDTGWHILDDKRPGVREKLLAEVALRPRAIADYAEKWKGGRPDEAHALSQLKFDGGFGDDAAKLFLRVFDETIRFTAGHENDKVPDIDEEDDRELEEKTPDKTLVERVVLTKSVTPSSTKGKLMEGERELVAGMLSKSAGFRVIVTGDVGVKEIERLIAKLELDKEILAEQDPEAEE